MEPVHSAGQLSRGPNSHVSSAGGTRKPLRAASTTTVRPNSEPRMVGNSGPRRNAAATYGTVIARDANRANLQTRTPSAKLRFGPKKRVMNDTTSSGTRIPATAWSTATFTPIRARKSLHSV